MSLRDKQQIGELRRQLAHLERELAQAKETITAVMLAQSKNPLALLALKRAWQSEQPKPPESSLSATDAVRKRSMPFPGLKEALVQFMGGSPEAEKAAAMIVELPDPISLLNKFADIFGLPPAEMTAQAATSPPKPAFAANAPPPATTPK